MRLTVVLILLFLQVSANVRSQEKVTLNIKNGSLESVLREIGRQTGYQYAMQDQWKTVAKKINISVEGASLNDVLDVIFEKQPFTYEIVQKIIVVKGKEGNRNNNEERSEHEKEGLPGIRGAVLSEKGEALAGATVVIRELKVSGQTDSKGEFDLPNIPIGKYHMEISFIGYEKIIRDIYITDQAIKIVVRLRRITSTLDETIIKGYYNTTQRLNTGDISKVAAEEIEKQPVSNVLQALEGRVPGMYITQTTGIPGASINVQIRGKNSIANGGDPLYIIDGVPYASTSALYYGVLGGGSPLNYLSPSDIESVSVLKDADATAIYGSRGANGVVLITTKKGKSENFRIDLSVYGGIGKVPHLIPYMNTQQYLAMRHEAFKNDSATPNPSFDYDVLGGNTWDTTRYTNWQKKLIGGTSKYSDAQLSVSGGNINSQYLIAGGYHRETTVFPGDRADQKGSVHFNITSSSPNKKFTIQFSGNYVAESSNLIPVDFTGFVQTPPDAPLPYNPDGTLNWAGSTWPNGIGNPYAGLLQTYKTNITNLISNCVLGYHIINGLEIKANIGYNITETKELATIPTISLDPAYGITSGNTTSANTSIRSWIVEPQISYSRIIGAGKLNVLLGSTIQQNVTEQQLINASGFISDAILTDLQAASSIQISSSNSQYKYGATFSRINYDWNEKYLINLTARRDGSSRFGPGRQFANFGALGIGWIFSKEGFVQNNISGLSFGKLRASYGITGNDQIGNYQYLDLYNVTLYPYQNSQGLLPGNLFNPNLEWEVNKKIEFGAELGFLKDKILVSANYYRNRTSNQLLPTSLSTVTGFPSIYSNVPATVQNAGFEATISSTNLKTKDFTWTTSFNITINRNKLVSFPGLAQSAYVNTLVIGQPITMMKKYAFLGANPETGIYQFKTAKGEPTYSPSSPADLISILNTAPLYYGGIQNRLIYKGFQLDFLFQFVKKNGYNFLYNGLPGLMGSAQPLTAFDRWQKPGDNKPLMKFTQNGGLYNNYIYQSDQGFGDASFIRLTNVSLSYQLPEVWRKKISAQNCRVFFHGQNLLTITRYKGYDPETLGGTTLPPLRVLTFGLQVSF